MRILLLSIIFCLGINGYSQKRAAIKLYERAQSSKQIHEAKALYQQAIEKDPSYTKAYSTLAKLHHTLQQSAKEVQTLQAALKHTKGAELQFKMRLCRAAYLAGQYELAQNTINELPEIPKTLTHLQACIAYAIDATQQAQEYHPKNMGTNINTQYDDYWPYISIDEQTLSTTVLISNDSTDFFTSNEDLYSSKKTSKGWSKSKAISPIINSKNNEGAQCFSADGKVMLFTACNRRTGLGSCDIFISYQQNGTWSSPKALPEPINTKYWDGHPSLSADGLHLYFASDRMHGLGKRDIYRAQIKLNTHHISIGKIEHLGANINSTEDEVSPFIHPDGKTLYFSSNGHIGLGRMDIFKTSIVADFSAPITNLGSPINTHNDEIGFVVNALGNTAYFSSQRQNSKKKDIYSFTLDKTLRPLETSYFKAIIYHAESKEKIKGKVELRFLNNDNVYYQNEETDEFIIPIGCQENYAITIEKEGFLFYSTQFSSVKQSSSPLVKEIYLTPIKENQSIALHNVLFDFNTAKLDTCFTSELQKALKLIKENPKLHFCIEGHTDAIGTETHNLQLSEQRALAVKNYLINHGAPSSQLSHKGYGSSQPVSADPRENRRTELRIRLPQEQRQ